MNKYVIAVLNFFDNDNTLTMVEAKSEIDAMRELANEYGIELSQDMDMDDIRGEFFDCEVSVSFPLKID